MRVYKFSSIYFRHVKSSSLKKVRNSLALLWGKGGFSYSNSYNKIPKPQTSAFVV